MTSAELISAVLWALEGKESVAAADVAHAIHGDAEEVSRALQGLCDRQFAYRQRDSHGTVLYTLTPEGRHAAVSAAYPAGALYFRKGRPNVRVRIVMLAWNTANEEFSVIFQPSGGRYPGVPTVRRLQEFLRNFERVRR